MKNRILLLAIIAIALTSCAGLTHVTVPQSNVNIVGKDIETVRYVEFKLTKTYVFGIGGLSAKARNTNVIKELFRKANLQDNETLAYISVSQNFNTFIAALFVKTNITASGYVVRPKGNYDDQLKESPLEQNNKVRTYETTGGAAAILQIENDIDSAETEKDIIEIEKKIETYVENDMLTKKVADRLMGKVEDLKKKPREESPFDELYSRIDQATSKEEISKIKKEIDNHVKAGTLTETKAESLYYHAGKAKVK